MTEFHASELPRYQALALELLDLATDGPIGRSESDAIYKRITENRDSGKAYSSCGDLCHWMLFRLGVRLPLVNRAEAGRWTSGVNISRLVWKAPARAPGKGEVFEPGDILTVWNKPAGTDAHVFVVREHTGRTIHSSDYGQPGGAMRARELDGLILGGRVIQRVLKLRNVLSMASAAGALVEPQGAEEWLKGTANA